MKNKRLHLFWADKFRELIKNTKNKTTLINKYLKFCNKEEKELNKRWEKHMKEKSIT